MYQLYTIPGSCSTGIHVLLNSLDIKTDIILRDDVEDYASLVQKEKETAECCELPNG